MDETEASAFGSYNDTYHYTDIDDVVDEGCDKETIPFREVIVPVFFSVVVVFSLLGNILVIVLLAKYENVRSLTNALILNLAASDLVFAAGLPFWAYYHMYGWHLGEMPCKIVSFIFYVGFYSNGILLIMMTAHRYMSVVRPLSDLLTPRGFVGVLASVLIWTLGPLAASPALIFHKVVDGNTCQYADAYWEHFGIYQQNLMFLATVAVFFFCYSQILCKIVRSPAQRRGHRTLKLICILVIAFFVGWAPYNVLIFMSSTPDALTECESRRLWGNAFYVSRLLAYFHCCLNPVVYVFVGAKFKSHLKTLLRCGGGMRRSSVRSRHSRLTITSMTSGDESSL
ncbi:unnamed protein product [Merluccius merluccius]